MLFPKHFGFAYVRMTENETKFKRWNWSTDKILMIGLSVTKTSRNNVSQIKHGIFPQLILGKVG
jgi:hypothetical protein